MTIFDLLGLLARSSGVTMLHPDNDGAGPALLAALSELLGEPSMREDYPASGGRQACAKWLGVGGSRHEITLLASQAHNPETYAAIVRMGRPVPWDATPADMHGEGCDA